MNSSSNEVAVEKRKGPRISIAGRIDVRDAHSGELLGELVNLSAAGLMLIGPRWLASGMVFQLQIPLCADAEVAELTVGAETLWCQDANNTGSYWTGFQIIAISPEYRNILTALTSG